MKNKSIVTISLLLTLFLLFSLAGCAAGGGKEEQKSGTYERLVATSVSTCEVLEKLGVPSDQVVGVPVTTAYTIPEPYRDAKEVGSPMSPDLEILSSLAPDLVLSPLSLKDSLETQYRELGVESYFLDLSSVEGMYDSIEALGTMLDREKEAAQLKKEYQNFLDDYRSKHEADRAPRVLLLMGLPGSYVVATESSYAGSLVKMAGAENVYGDGDGESFLNVNPEDMLKKEPDIILRTSHAMPDKVKKMFAEEFRSNDIWQHFTAVQDGKVYDLSNEHFGMSANFEYPAALEELSGILYGS